MKLELIATATFGLEAVVKREIEGLGYKILRTEDAKVTYLGDERAVARSNLRLRCADRVLIKMAEFSAPDFEALFQQTKGIPWEYWIPADGRIQVSGTSVKSVLRSVPACQSIVKKAVLERLRESGAAETFPESGPAYPIKVTLLKDRATVTLDTSGPGLHKRGYRTADVEAPIKETLAAALVQLSFFREGRVMADPCCGSGTIAIEAAMLARNIAPGLGRRFGAEAWGAVPPHIWQAERKAAFEAVRPMTASRILAMDISRKALDAARENAAEAGVEEDIRFAAADISSAKSAGILKETGAEDGMIITNPPYGQRIGDQKEMEKIYGGLGRFLRENPGWSLFLITTDKDAEKKILGRPAHRRRKLYNGRLETCFYQFHGAKTEHGKETDPVKKSDPTGKPDPEMDEYKNS